MENYDNNYLTCNKRDQHEGEKKLYMLNKQ